MIREAHAATKDLRAAVREARQEMRVLAAAEVAAHIQAEPYPAQAGNSGRHADEPGCPVRGVEPQ